MGRGAMAKIGQLWKTILQINRVLRPTGNQPSNSFWLSCSFLRSVPTALHLEGVGCAVTPIDSGLHVGFGLHCRFSFSLQKSALPARLVTSIDPL